MEQSFSELLKELRDATRGTEIRDALVACLQALDDSINVDPPTNCPNCGAAVTGKSANCEYCGTMLLWKNHKTEKLYADGKVFAEFELE